MSRSLQQEDENVHYFNDDQVNIIEIIMIISNALSFVGALFVIINYYLIKSLRNQLSYKLILWIAVSDLLFSIGYLIGTPTSSFFCYFQAMITQFAGIASIFWVVAVSWTINFLISTNTLPTKGRLRKILKIMHIVIWSLSFLTTMLPLFTNTYGPAGGWCWFVDDKLIDVIWRYLLWYFIVWISIIYMIAIYIKAWIKIRKTNVLLRRTVEQSQNSVVSRSEGFNVSGDDDTDKNQVEMVDMESNETELNLEKAKQRKRAKALQRMILFPLILIISWTFASIRRVIEFTGSDVPFWLACIHILLSSLVGFFDALVYGFTKDVRNIYKQYCKRSCCDDDDDAW